MRWLRWQSGGFLPAGPQFEPLLVQIRSHFNEIYLKILTIFLILYWLGNSLKTLNTLSLATGYPDYRVGIYLYDSRSQSCCYFVAIQFEKISVFCNYTKSLDNKTTKTLSMSLTYLLRLVINWRPIPQRHENRLYMLSIFLYLRL